MVSGGVGQVHDSAVPQQCAGPAADERRGAPGNLRPGSLPRAAAGARLHGAGRLPQGAGHPRRTQGVDASLCLSLSLAPYVCLCGGSLSFPLSVPPFISLFLCLSVFCSFSLSVSISLSVYLCMLIADAISLILTSVYISIKLFIALGCCVSAGIA